MESFLPTFLTQLASRLEVPADKQQIIDYKNSCILFFFFIHPNPLLKHLVI